MESGVRYFLTSIFAISAILFCWIGYAIGDNLPKGPAPLYLLGGVCAVCAIAVWRYKGRTEIGTPQFDVNDHSLVGLLKRKRSELLCFDLNRLTVVGWILLFSSFPVLIGFCVMSVSLLNHQVERPIMRVGAVLCLAATLGWFFAMKWALETIGVKIVRPAEQDSPVGENSQQDLSDADHP